MKLSRTLALAAAAIVAIPAIAQAVPTSEYLMKAGASDLYEKRSSELVLQSTKNPEIRKFANMMIADHTKSTGMVKDAAMHAGLHPSPPMLSAKQTRMVADLRAARGMQRDTLYVSQQKEAHQMALDLQRDYSLNGDKAPLKGAAAKIVPVVEQHISMLNAMPAM